MKAGVIFPTMEIGTDPGAIRDFILAAEVMNFAHFMVYDHVLGADVARTDRRQGPYTNLTPFHEPFIVLGFAAALTARIELVTGVIILPQRQTALVAKQTAELDILSGGRLRLGVGTGWNKVEYDGLGMDVFHVRGKRQEEQIELLRKLWTGDVVKFEGKWDAIDDANITPASGRRIPIWLGGSNDTMLRRAANLGDGWLAIGPVASHKETVARLDTFLAEAGRTRGKDFGHDAIVLYGDGDTERMASDVAGWRELGATHLSLNLMNAGLRTPEEYSRAMETWLGVVNA